MVATQQSTRGVKTQKRIAFVVMYGLCVIILAASFSLSLRPFPLVFFEPFSEDGYYSLTIARNIALGHGVTIHGENLTNGFQPVITFIQSFFFLITGGDSVLAARAIIIFNFLVYGFTAYIFSGAIVRSLCEFFHIVHNKKIARIASFLLFISGTHLFFAYSNGLETGLIIFCYIFYWRLLQRHYRSDMTRALVLGVFGGLTILVRVDAGFFVVLVAVAEFARERASFRHALLTAFLILASALFVSLPWWAYNYIEFGNFIPISGRALQRWVTTGPEFIRRLEGLYNFSVVSAVPWTYLPYQDFLPAQLFDGWRDPGPRHYHILVRAPLFLLVGYLIIKFVSQASRKRDYFPTILLINFFILASWYLFSSAATFFYGRYLSFLGILGVAAASVFLIRRGYDWLAPAFAVPIFALALYPLWQDVFQIMKSGDYIGSMHARAPTIDLISKHVPPADIVAAGQSGTVGFFCPTIVNMDGKVNPEILPNRGRLDQYLQEKNIRWFVDNEAFTRRILGPNPAVNGWRVVDKRGGITLFYRDTLPDHGTPPPPATDTSMQNIRASLCR